MLAAGKGGLRFLRSEISAEDPDASSSALASRIAEAGEADGINPIEIALALIDGLARAQPPLRPFALMPEDLSPAALSVRACPFDIRVAARVGGGVNLTLSRSSQSVGTRLVETAEQFVSALAGVVAWPRASPQDSGH